jgi:pimeloyl-ACP methyl ester carboxylesterase
MYINSRFMSLDFKSRPIQKKTPSSESKNPPGNMTTANIAPLSSGESVFYRSAGNSSNPALLLLHGFPTSSHQFRHLAPALADKNYVIAPDFPGFGFTTVPSGYKHTFESLARTILGLVDHLQLKTFGIYIFDYGAPVGLRIALERPDAVKAVITQNGNAFDEGLGAFWDPVRDLWNEDNARNRATLASALLTFEATKWQYETGVPDKEKVKAVEPETYWLDYALLERPGNKNIQLDLFKDYQSNVKLYPKFQEWFKKYRPAVLAVWGRNDPIFVKEGTEGFKKLGYEVILLDAGHFVLETHFEEVVGAIRKFLDKSS